jgi:hypothetical protein
MIVQAGISELKMRSLIRALLGGTFILAIGSLAQAAISHLALGARFDAIREGDTMSVVIDRLGMPSAFGPRTRGAGNYDSGASRASCSDSCWIRFEYRQPLTFDTSVLVVDFDLNRTVIHKSHHRSP